MFATIAGRYPTVDGSPSAALDAVLGDQLEAGLGMVGDGQVRRLDEDGDVAAAVEAWRTAATALARLLGDGHGPAPALKACLVGPVSTPRDPDAAVVRVAGAIRALHAAGAPVVQIEEPWSTTPEAATDAGRQRARLAWGALLAQVRGHVTLALPGGGPTTLGLDVLMAAPFGSHLVDLVAGPDDWRVVAQIPGERGVILGVTDLRRGADTREVLLWAARYAASMQGRGLARVGLAPSAGLERLDRAAARARLAVLAEVAALATLPPEELLRQVDPRSIDARSAALGRWEPNP